jgi:predicted nucleic acid-binding protein
VIILDTNVVSELMRPRPEPSVVSWVDRLDPAIVMLTAITAAELRTGVARMPRGRRRDEIDHRIELLLTGTFDGQVLPFDVTCSIPFAAVVTLRAAQGLPISFQDAQITAIASLRESTLATRNVVDFEGTGVAVVNPWTS